MTPVRVGLDVLVSRLGSLLAGRRVGVLCHQASVTRDLTHAADAIRKLRRVRLTALFGPEHGLAGVVQDHVHVGRARDRARGVPVHSLYGGRRLEPTRAMLRDVDVLVVDLQDVGARYYTYAWTIVLAMRVCAREGKPVVVLDRPNPLGGERARGKRRRPQVRVVRRPLPAADPPRHDHRGAGRLPQRDAGDRLRPHRGPDGGLATRDALGGHRAAVGGPLAQHADPRHRARVPGRLPARGNEPLRGPAAPRGPSSGSVHRTSTGRGWPRRSSVAGCPARASAPSPSSPCSRSGRAAPATACRCT